MTHQRRNSITELTQMSSLSRRGHYFIVSNVTFLLASSTLCFICVLKECASLLSELHWHWLMRFEFRYKYHTYRSYTSTISLMVKFIYRGPFFKYVEQILPIIDHLPTHGLWRNLFVVKKGKFAYRWHFQYQPTYLIWSRQLKNDP